MVLASMGKAQRAMVPDRSQQKQENHGHLPPFLTSEGPSDSRPGAQKKQRGSHHRRCIYCAINKEHGVPSLKFYLEDWIFIYIISIQSSLRDYWYIKIKK